MRIIYADDAPEALEEVQTVLAQHGHEIETISTTNILDFQGELNAALNRGFVPEVVVCGGRNLLRNSEGQELFNLGAFEIRNWLNQSDLPAECRFILYSRNAELVARAAQREWGFDAGVLKGREDSINQLLAAITQQGK